MKNGDKDEILLFFEQYFNDEEEMEIMREKKNTTIVDRLPYNKYRYAYKTIPRQIKVGYKNLSQNMYHLFFHIR